jgi:hypothetical protein
MADGSGAVPSSGREGQGKSRVRTGLSRSRTGEVRTGGVTPCVSQSVPHPIVIMSRPERVRAGSTKLRAREIANGHRYADTCDIRLLLGGVLVREARALEVPMTEVSPRLPQVLSAHVMGIRPPPFHHSRRRAGCPRPNAPRLCRLAWEQYPRRLQKRRSRGCIA